MEKNCCIHCVQAEKRKCNWSGLTMEGLQQTTPKFSTKTMNNQTCKTKGKRNDLGDPWLWVKRIPNIFLWWHHFWREINSKLKKKWHVREFIFSKSDNKQPQFAQQGHRGCGCGFCCVCFSFLLLFDIVCYCVLCCCPFCFLVVIVVVVVFAAVDVVFGVFNSPDSVSTLQVLAVIRC